MKKFLLFMTACSLLLSAAILYSARSAAIPFPHPSGAEAMKYAQETMRIVPRYSGSPGAEKTAKMIEAAAKSMPGFRVTVDSFADMTPDGEKQFRNVIAELPGKSKEFIVIGAHYDSKKLESVPLFAGANDGASGVGALLAMMKAVSSCGKELPLTLKFVFFDGEEALLHYTETDGLHGSRRYVRELVRNKLVRSCKAMVLLDMVGDKELRLTLPSDTNLFLQGMAVKAANELGYKKYMALNGPAMLDDHTPFMKEGIPAIDLIDFDYGRENMYWHTGADSADKISEESLGISSAIALKLVWKLMELEE